MKALELISLPEHHNKFFLMMLPVTHTPEHMLQVRVSDLAITSNTDDDCSIDESQLQWGFARPCVTECMLICLDVWAVEVVWSLLFMSVCLCCINYLLHPVDELIAAFSFSTVACIHIHFNVCHGLMAQRTIRSVKTPKEKYIISFIMRTDLLSVNGYLSHFQTDVCHSTHFHFKPFSQ